MSVKFKNTSGIKDEKIFFVNKRTEVNIEVMQDEGFTLYYVGFLRGYKKDMRDLPARCLKAQHLSRSRVHSQGNSLWCLWSSSAGSIH